MSQCLTINKVCILCSLSQFPLRLCTHTHVCECIHACVCVRVCERKEGGDYMEKAAILCILNFLFI